MHICGFGGHDWTDHRDGSRRPAGVQAHLGVQGGPFLEDASATLERKWTAVVSVDTSGCAANSSGYFEIVFTRLKEIGPDIEFREQFVWLRRQ